MLCPFQLLCAGGVEWLVAESARERVSATRYVPPSPRSWVFADDRCYGKGGARSHPRPLNHPLAHGNN
jgi:hypothetical protein